VPVIATAAAAPRPLPSLSARPIRPSHLGMPVGCRGVGWGGKPLALAIAMGDKALGAEHPLTGRYQSHYARLLLMTDRPAEALQLARSALAAHERVNGPNHPWTKDSAGVTADDCLLRLCLRLILRRIWLWHPRRCA